MTNRLFALGTCLLTVSACNQLPQDSEDVTDGDTGEVTLAVTTIPTGVAALVVKTMSGLHESNRCFNVTAGQSAKVTMPGLPAGQVMIVANAYTGACTPSSSTAATWLSDPATVTVPAGGSVAVKLVMRRAGGSTPPLISSPASSASPSARSSTAPRSASTSRTTCATAAPAGTPA
jgi:hypothetical protein